MNFTPSDEHIDVYRRIENPTIREMVSKQTLLGVIGMLRIYADDVRAPGPYPDVRNVKPIDCDQLYEFLNAIADRLECLAGLRKEGGRGMSPTPCVCGNSGVLETRTTESPNPYIMPLYETRVHCYNCGRCSMWYTDGNDAVKEWNGDAG